MKHFIPAALVCLSATMASAGGVYDVSGSSVGTSTSTYMPMGESHIFVDLNSEFTLPDNGTPMAGMPGKCFGYMEIAMGQGAQGSGVCTWTDADGDSWYGPWSVTGMSPDRASIGTWTAAGGTGKFAGITGGGSFASLTDPSTGASRLDVSGSVILK